ncbi:NADPH:quinone reductase [Mortierella sp. 14UC]|nr:NADPH:quinone reductase [Mortierella sp. 14UC]
MVAATTRAIQVDQHGDASVLKQAIVPRPTYKPDQVLIKVAYSGVNYLDIIERKASGEIIEVGSEVQHGFKVGDRAAFIGVDTYAEYVAISTFNLAKLSDSTSLADGAAFLLQGLIAVGLVRQGYAVKRGDWIVIHAAAGGVGLLATQLARLLGAHVIGTVSTDEKAALVKVAGAEHVVLINHGYKALETKNVKDTWTDLDNYITTRKEFDELHSELAGYLAKGQLKLDIHKVYSFNEVQ